MMATFYALHDAEAEEKEEVTTVEGPRKALKAVKIDEPRALIHLGQVGADQEQRWYLDSGASNHIFRCYLGILHRARRRCYRYGEVW